jgi:RimJ/RimL family protein N-acetyltransferase
VTVALSRLSLHLYSADDAALVIAGRQHPGEIWARDYPLFDELDFLKALVHDRRSGKDPGVFGLYQVRLHDDGVVIGGVGFFGPPDEFGAVEVVFGIVPDHAGHGYGAEAVAGLVEVARENGARFVIASTRVDHLPAQRTLLHAGFDEVVRDETIAHFAREF